MKNKTYALLLVASLTTIPLAFADHNGVPVGSPRNECDNITGDTSHEYGPSTGFVIFLPQDGNLNDCDLDFDPANPETETADYDGHLEFLFGGAYLTAASSPGCNDGDWVDHPAFPVVSVRDYVLTDLLAASVGFSVYADTLNNVPPVDPNEPNCGDFESDFGVDCTDSCAVGFPPGLDGSYQVYVNGVTGEITTSSSAALCADVPNTYSLPQGGVTGEARGRGCNHVQVTNGGPGTVELTFFPSGRVCGPLLPGTSTCPWLNDNVVVLRAVSGAAVGTWVQTT